MAEIDEMGDGDGLAAEYVLGTLSTAERTEVERRLSGQPELARAIADWERRLDPLFDTIRPVAPPADSFAAISTRIAASAAEPSRPMRSADIVDLRRRLRRWQGGAIAAAALAASLMVFIAVRETTAIRDEKFVAVLEGDDRKPAFVAAVSTKDKSITVLRVGGPLAPTPGHSHELWALGGDSPGPRSLGVIGPAFRFPAEKLGDTAELQQTTFAISVEPEGGSPTGKPTGPVVFTGKLVPVPGK